MVEDILDVLLTVIVTTVLIVLTMKFGILPWVTLSVYEAPMEKTALRTTSEIDGYDYHLKAADAYLSIAIADANQPDPVRVRFYETADSNFSGNNSKYSYDGLNDESTDGVSDIGYYQVFYSTQYAPSAVNNKMTVGNKVINWTNYNPSDNISLLLRPRVGDGDNNARLWCFGLNSNKMKGDSKTKSEKHDWFCVE